MPTISEAMTPKAFAELDALCVRKLAPVSFGLQNRADSIMKGIAFQLDKKQPVSWRQRVAMYSICYRFRRQIGDMAFIARVLIAKAEADPLAEGERHRQGRPQIRAWAAGNLFEKSGSLL